MFFLGIFGGGLLWLVLVGLRFDYLISEVYDGGGPGEAIWSIDPLFTILAAIPGIILVFAGLFVSIQSTPEMGYQQLHLFYMGEICILVTIVVSLIGFLSISSLTAGVFGVSMIIMGAIVITCIIHILSFVLLGSIHRLDLLKLSRNTAILLAVELVILISVVLAFQLYTWSLIGPTTLVITSSGILGLLLLTPRFLNSESKNGAEGEI
jgi:hypothetical protein